MESLIELIDLNNNRVPSSTFHVCYSCYSFNLYEVLFMIYYFIILSFVN